MPEIPLGGRARDTNSRKSRESIFNAYIEQDKSGEFRRIIRAGGLREYLSAGTGPIRGMRFYRGELYFVSGSEFFRRQTDGNIVKLGDIDPNQNIVDIETNGSDAGQIIIISDGAGWYLDQDGVTFAPITDIDFTPDKTVAFLAGRVWLNNPDSNRFFASEINDVSSYNSLDFALASDAPDPVVVMESVRSNLIIMGAASIEVWQLVTDEFPVRRITGATLDRGVLSPDSVVRFEDALFFLADDLTVRMYQGGQIPEISDLALNKAITGDGTNNNPGYSRPDLAEGLLIDAGEHRFYGLTFPRDGATWLYDLTTGQWHRRSSFGIERWRGRVSQATNDGILVGDYLTGKIYVIDHSIHDEDGELQPMVLQTPPISDAEAAIFISRIELNMEVGQGTISNVIRPNTRVNDGPVSAKMGVEFSRDGGQTWVRRSDVNLGKVGDYQHVVSMYSFGRTKKNFEFVLRFTVTDDIPISIYRMFADIDRGI